MTITKMPSKRNAEHEIRMLASGKALTLHGQNSGFSPTYKSF